MIREITFWEDHFTNFYYQQDLKVRKKINELIKDIHRKPYEGLGKPEPLKYDLSGFWSRRIDREHRLVYQVIGEDILIYSCRYHYDK